MKQHITSLFVLLALMMAGSGCTRNGGDIGIWFGTWSVDSYTIDGQQQQLDPDGMGTAYYVQFQRSVVCLRHTDALHNGGESYGTWNESDDGTTMTIAFDPSNYDVPLMPQQATYSLTRSDDRHVVMRTTGPDGRVHEYAISR